jgi:hypothetical protein
LVEFVQNAEWLVQDLCEEKVMPYRSYTRHKRCEKGECCRQENEAEIARLRAENERLRAALKAVMPIAEAFAGRVDKEPALQIGRAAAPSREE